MTSKPETRNPELKVLLIEDDPEDADCIREILCTARGYSFDIEWAEQLEAGSARLVQKGADVILLDLSLPDSQGFDTFTRVHAQAREVPIVVLTGLDDEELAVRAVREGAQDYLIKAQIDGNLLVRSLCYAVERKRNLADLEKSDRVKTEFLGFVSHELRTPLNAIVGYTNMLQDEALGEINHEQEQVLGKILRHSHNLHVMINSLLEATKIGAGAVDLKIHELQLVKFLDELKSCYTLPLDKEVGLIWDYPPELPFIRTDSGKVRHILQNLINNAIKFSPKGHVTISARCLSGTKTVEFKVEDTGVGIPKELLPVIFEMFRQVDSTHTTPSGGVGLGLYIVKQFTELLGGEVEVESEVGRGTAFTVVLPQTIESN